MAGLAEHTHRFRCVCGKVNQFTVSDGPARSVKVRCGACKQVCRMDVPAHDSKSDVANILDDILRSRWSGFHG